MSFMCTDIPSDYKWQSSELFGIIVFMYQWGGGIGDTLPPKRKKIGSMSASAGVYLLPW